MLKAKTFAYVVLAGLAALAWNPALAQPGPGGFRGGPGGGGTLGLLGIPEVREEIDLMPDQEEALQKLNERMRERMREVMGGNRGGQADAGDDADRGGRRGRGRGGFSEEQQQQMAQLMQEMNAQLEQILLPPQIDRLKEIEIQQMGAAALQVPDVQAKLNLTAEQKQKLEEIGQSSRERMGEAFAAARESGDFGAVREKMQEVRDELEQESLQVLNEEQKQQFEDLKGEPFEMPERRGFGRGGRGGRGPGDRGDGNRQ